MTELKLEQIKQIAGGGGSCGRDKGGAPAPAPACQPKPSNCGSNS